jgi:hypothetical protein
MLAQYCKLRFGRLKRTDFNSLLNEVKNGIYSNTTVFATPSVTETEFLSLQNIFLAAQANYETYGITKKVDYTTARKAMLDTLYTLAQYVDTIAQGNESVIALSGFTPSVSVPKKNEKLEKISHFEILRTPVEGELMIKIPAILDKGTVHYTCLCIKGSEVPEISTINGQLHINSHGAPVLIDTNKSRKKKFAQLTPGSLYHLCVYATNTVSVSPISNVRSVWAS